MRSHFTGAVQIEIYSRVLTKCAIESLDNFIGLDKVIADMDGTGSYFLNVFNNRGVDLGILRLRKRRDRYSTSSFSEWGLFCSLGNGFIEMEGKC